jgi:hypothetical protein
MISLIIVQSNGTRIPSASSTQAAEDAEASAIVDVAAAAIVVSLFLCNP